MQSSRRKFLLGSGAVVAAASVAGYKDTLGAVITLSDKGQRAKDSIYFNSAPAEYSLLNKIYTKPRFQSGADNLYRLYHTMWSQGKD